MVTTRSTTQGEESRFRAFQGGLKMRKASFVIFLALAAVSTYAKEQGSQVGPVAPKPTPTIAQVESDMHSLLSVTTADKVWEQSSGARLIVLMTNLAGATEEVQKILGQEPSQPKPKSPGPSTSNGPAPKPTKEEVEAAMTDFHKLLEQANEKAPTKKVSTKLGTSLDDITAVLRSVR